MNSALLYFISNVNFILTTQSYLIELYNYLKQYVSILILISIKFVKFCIQRLKKETRPLRKGNPTAKKGKEPILK